MFNYNLLFELPFVQMKLYNPVHIMVVLFFPILAVVSYFIFRKRSEKAKAIYMWVLLAITAFATLSTFATDVISNRANNYRADLLANLPLHMCSINVFLYPLFFGLRNKMNKLFKSTTFAYMYFMGSIGALLAMVVTAPGDCAGNDINFLTYNVFTYWLKHGLIFIIPIIFVVLGFYRPKFIDVIKAVVFLLVLLTTMECINVLFTFICKMLGGSDVANYFYTRTGKGTAVLDILWKYIPIELIYLLPLAVVAVPLFSLYYAPVGIIDLIKSRVSKSKKAKNE